MYYMRIKYALCVSNIYYMRIKYVLCVYDIMYYACIIGVLCVSRPVSAQATTASHDCHDSRL